MSLTAKLNYDDFVLAADKLFYEHMEMPTAAKAHHLIGHDTRDTLNDLNSPLIELCQEV